MNCVLMEATGNERRRKRRFVPVLPDEIIMDIVSRLPAKTILGCHRVCKSWRDILRHPAFAKLHFTRSSSSLLQKNRRKHVCSDDLLLVDLESPNIRGRKAQIKKSLPITYFSISDSRNGFILLCNDLYSKAYIVNPLNDDYLIIRKSPKDHYGGIHLRFGFCPKSEQYKVLQLSHLGGMLWEFDIITLNSGSSGCWRSLGLFKTKVMQCPSMCYDGFLNGCLHWLVRDIDTSSDFIFSFDFENETLQPIPPPLQLLTQEHNSRQANMRLGVLASCLSISDYAKQDHCDIWVMKEYGVQDSWTKQFVIQLPNYGGWISKKSQCSFLPVKLLNNDEEILLLHNDKKLVRYNFRKKQIKDSRMFGSGKRMEAVSHVPSFLKFGDIGI